MFSNHIFNIYVKKKGFDIKLLTVVDMPQKKAQICVISNYFSIWTRLELLKRTHKRIPLQIKYAHIVL